MYTEGLEDGGEVAVVVVVVVVVVDICRVVTFLLSSQKWQVRTGSQVTKLNTPVSSQFQL